MLEFDFSGSLPPNLRQKEFAGTAVPVKRLVLPREIVLMRIVVYTLLPRLFVAYLVPARESVYKIFRVNNLWIVLNVVATVRMVRIRIVQIVKGFPLIRTPAKTNKKIL